MPNYMWGVDSRTTKCYEPISLFDIQRLVDTGRLNPDKLIDITALINARLLEPADLLWSEDIHGLRLVADGANELAQPLNIEMQMADKDAIAAVERLGGQFYSTYFDHHSIQIAVNPIDFFLSGKAMKKRELPPNHLWEYYTDGEHRGYLASAQHIMRGRVKLAKVD